jgi:hypothetical protein
VVPAAHWNTIDPDLHARALPEVRASLLGVALGAQPLQVRVVVRATLEERHDVI